MPGKNENITIIYDEAISPLRSVYFKELHLLVLNPNYHNK